MNSILRDIRFAARALLKNPGYASVAVLALALGIGLNSSTYSTADALLFRPLLLDDLERLAEVEFEPPGRPGNTRGIPPGDYYEWKDSARSFERFSAFDSWDANLAGEGDPEQVLAFKVTAEFFQTLGEEPRIGRSFLENEDIPGNDRVAVLSHELWERRFGADPAIVGREIQLDGRNHEVIGIAAERVRYPSPAELWVPLALSPKERETRSSAYLEIIGRLRPGVSVEQARAEMDLLMDRAKEAYPDEHENVVMAVYPLRIAVSGTFTARYTRLMLYAVGFVLLIACVNVAGLQFARISSRTKEMTIRLALGAGRWALLRIVLIENLLLSLAGTALGVVLAHWGVALIKSGMPPEVEQFLPGWQRMSINGNVLLFTVVVGVAAGLAAGLVPALLSTRINVQSGLRENTRSSTAGASHHRLRGILVVSEVVLAMVLLIGASLMVNSLQTITTVSPNMEPDELLTFRVSLPSFRYPDGADHREFSRQLIEGLRKIPGVDSAGMVNSLPYSGWNRHATYTIEERLDQGSEATVSILNRVVSEDYFDTMQIPLINGRFFNEDDGEDQPAAGIVNASFAQRYFADGDAIGKRIKLGFEDSTDPWFIVVGVVGDVMMSPSDDGPRPTMYRSYRQIPIGQVTYVLRVQGDPLATAGPVRQAVAALDPQQPIYNVRTMEKMISEKLTGIKYMAAFMSVFGIMALVLSLMGVYSIMAHSVAERTGEIGIRMALGADSGSVLWLVLRRGLALTGIGLAFGTALSVPMARLLSGLIWGISPNDMVSFGGTIVLFLATSVAACLIPALRAARTDPITALRYE